MSDQLIKAIGDLTEKINEAQKKAEGETKKSLEKAEKEANELKENLKKLEEKQQKEHDEFVQKLTEKDATIGQIQGEVKELKAKGGRPGGGAEKVKTIFAQVADAIEEHKQKFVDMHEKKADKLEMIQLKTVANISSSNNSANYLQYLPWQPGMEPIGQDRFRDLVPTILSSEDFVQYPRANVPIGEGSFNRQTEAAAKQQVDRDYTMVSLTLKPMAGYAICSRQSLRNIPFLQTWLPQSMLEQLMDSEDTDFANTLVAAATGSSTTSLTVKVEKIVDYIKNLRKQKHNPNGVCIDPDVWVTILLTKPQDYSLPNIVTVDQVGTVKILGRPVYAVNWLTGGRVIVGDFRKAAIVQSEGLTMRTSDSHSTTFVSNEITFLLERTEGLAIFRPDAFVTAVP